MSEFYSDKIKQKIEKAYEKEISSHWRDYAEALELILMEVIEHLKELEQTK